MRDSSAVLAIIQNERGSERIKRWLRFGMISTVNLAEVATKLCETQVSESRVLEIPARFGFDVRDLDEAQAIRVGLLRKATRAHGLSLGDRACPAITTDVAWGRLDIGIAIEVVR